ncbi:MAG: alpha/beta fold hydrolase, partial [Polyangiaceae bacterium]
GSESSCLPVGERIARVAPNARLVSIAGGHFLPLEAPADLTCAIVAFVDRDPVDREPVDRERGARDG